MRSTNTNLYRTNNMSEFYDEEDNFPNYNSLAEKDNAEGVIIRVFNEKEFETILKDGQFSKVEKLKKNLRRYNFTKNFLGLSKINKLAQAVGHKNIEVFDKNNKAFTSYNIEDLNSYLEMGAVIHLKEFHQASLMVSKAAYQISELLGVNKNILTSMTMQQKGSQFKYSSSQNDRIIIVVKGHLNIQNTPFKQGDAFVIPKGRARNYTATEDLMTLNFELEMFSPLDYVFEKLKEDYKYHYSNSQYQYELKSHENKEAYNLEAQIKQTEKNLKRLINGNNIHTQADLSDSLLEEYLDSNENESNDPINTENKITHLSTQLNTTFSPWQLNENSKLKLIIEESRWFWRDMDIHGDIYIMVEGKNAFTKKFQAVSEKFFHKIQEKKIFIAEESSQWFGNDYEVDWETLKEIFEGLIDMGVLDFYKEQTVVPPRVNSVTELSLEDLAPLEKITEADINPVNDNEELKVVTQVGEK